MSTPPPPNPNTTRTTSGTGVGGVGVGGGMLDLSHAMKFADIIRKHYQEDETKKRDFNSTILPTPPGVVHGVSAAIFTGVALMPIRRVILRAAGDTPIRTFLDLTISVSQALAATQVGLVIGSIFGCQTYLQDFVQTHTTTQESALADRICDSVWESSSLSSSLSSFGLPMKNVSSDNNNYTNNNFDNPPPIWDFKASTLSDLQKAIDCCHRRQEYRNNT